MSALNSFLDSFHPGYYRTGESERFPFDFHRSGIWYSLLVVENGRICRYGWTNAKAQKHLLLAALKAMPVDTEHLLLGVWTGASRTDLFVLDSAIAIRELEKLPKSNN